MSAAFVPMPLVDGGQVEHDGVRVRTWGGAPVRLDGGTVFGFVDRTTRVRLDDDNEETFVLRAGCYFVAPDGASLSGGRGLAVVVPGYRGLRQMGGPLEASGRLRYIDGCTDTLLVSPPRRGEPCVNHLHVPAGTRQSEHFHPSVRIGTIARGRGTCVAGAQRWPLEAGMGWVIPRERQHFFETTDSALDVFTWHPDTDVGPTDEDHPMVNRTWR